MAVLSLPMPVLSATAPPASAGVPGAAPGFSAAMGQACGPPGGASPPGAATGSAEVAKYEPNAQSQEPDPAPPSQDSKAAGDASLETQAEAFLLQSLTAAISLAPTVEAAPGAAAAPSSSPSVDPAPVSAAAYGVQAEISELLPAASAAPAAAPTLAADTQLALLQLGQDANTKVSAQIVPAAASSAGPLSALDASALTASPAAAVASVSAASTGPSAPAVVAGPVTADAPLVAYSASAQGAKAPISTQSVSVGENTPAPALAAAPLAPIAAASPADSAQAVQAAPASAAAPAPVAVPGKPSAPPVSKPTASGSAPTSGSTQPVAAVEATTTFQSDGDASKRESDSQPDGGSQANPPAAAPVGSNPASATGVPGQRVETLAVSSANAGGTASAGTTNANAHLILRQAAAYIENLAVSSVRQGVTIQLEPRDLGAITVTVNPGETGIQASVSATHGDVRQVLAQNQAQLTAALHDRGIRVQTLQVSSSSSTGNPTGQGAGRQSFGRQPQASKSYSTPRRADPEGFGSSLNQQARRSAADQGLNLWI